MSRPNGFDHPTTRLRPPYHQVPASLPSYLWCLLSLCRGQMRLWLPCHRIFGVCCLYVAAKWVRPPYHQAPSSLPSGSGFPAIVSLVSAVFMSRPNEALAALPSYLWCLLSLCRGQMGSTTLPPGSVLPTIRFRLPCHRIFGVCCLYVAAK